MLTTSTILSNPQNSPPRFDSLGIPNPGISHELARGEVHVWIAELDIHSCDLDYLSQSLAPEEWNRANRFRFPIHRNRFIAARASLRSLLGGYLGAEPCEIHLSIGEHGKPFLPGGKLHFNISHSDDLMLAAVSWSPVGVDLERARPLEEMMQVAATVFSPVEMGALKALDASAREDAFYTIWARKEALLKGIGSGITEHCRDVTVSFAPEAEPAFPPNLSREPWQIIDLDVQPGFKAALATPIQESQRIVKLLRF